MSEVRRRRQFAPPRERKQWLRVCKPVLRLIRFYQNYISKEILSRKCRFNPTCSNYAYQAIDRHGLIIGGLLAYKRFVRCNPKHPGGFDPVP